MSQDPTDDQKAEKSLLTSMLVREGFSVSPYNKEQHLLVLADASWNTHFAGILPFIRFQDLIHKLDMQEVYLRRRYLAFLGIVQRFELNPVQTTTLRETMFFTPGEVNWGVKYFPSPFHSSTTSLTHLINMAHEAKPKVYLYCVSDPADGRNVHGYALAEDGEMIGYHISSDDSFSQVDLSKESHQEDYAKHYPDGYELVWVPPDQLTAHAAFNAAFQRHREKYNPKLQQKPQPQPTE